MSGPESVRLGDPASGATADVLTGYGFNCYRFQLPGADGPVDVLWSEEGFEGGQLRGAGSGIPVLFPYPGRLRGTAFRWQGDEYPQKAGDGRGNAIHGLVHERPWRVVDRGAQRVVGQFQLSLDAPDAADAWPADFRLTASYELAGTTLTCRLEIYNAGSRPLPCGLGLHPYLSVPLAGGSADACRVVIPAGARWELAEMLPTGRLLPLEDSQLQQGTTFDRLQLDDVFTALRFDDQRCQASLYDPQSDRKLTLEFDELFRELVVYTPPHRRAICIEPYSCVPNAAELAQQGIDSGLRVLQPAQSATGVVVLDVAQ